jgi:UDP-N-acetylmuramoyl-L-alanyl-D-glutamate--2,6-diaminopimelate ligase
MNAMAAILLSRRMNIPFTVISNALASFPGVPGRLETYRHPNGAHIIIDYAHTPDGLLQCLQTMSIYKPQRLVHIFGFRGNRDESKWKKMVEISRIYCDQTILTLDDLNGVSSENMLRLYEVYHQGGTQILADRTLAIQYAWNQSKPGDCIVITGKGTEKYQSSFKLPSDSDSSTIKYLQEKSSPLHTSRPKTEIYQHHE